MLQTHTYTYIHLCMQAVKKSQENGNDPSHSYEDYIWITHGWYPVNWWSLSVTPDPEELSAANESLCSDEAIAEMLSSSLAVNIIPLPDNNTMETDVGYVSMHARTVYPLLINIQILFYNLFEPSINCMIIQP